MNKAYDKVTWQNAPSSTATPLNASNLNKMSDALDTIDDRVITLDGQASSASSAITALQEGKVDKVVGKGLSTNDYDNTAKGIVDGVTSALANKVDKVEGYGLSENDYTTTEKTKLAGISAEANKVEITPVVTEGTTLATISIDGVDTAIKGSDIDVDSTPSSTSTNPLENKAVYELVQSILPEKTATGNPISIDDASGLNAKSALVTFAPKQSGTGDPSPSNIRPISGWDGLSLTRTGKNLVEITKTGSVTANGITWTVNSDGTITANGTATSTSVFLLKQTTDFGKDIQPNTEYIMSSGYGNNNIWFGLYYDDSTTWGVTVTNDGEKTFTTISDFNYVRFGLRIGNGTTVDNVTFKPMVRLSTISDSTFEKYNGQTHTATFPNTVYGGNYEFVSGEGDGTFSDKIDLGSLTWTYQSDSQRFYSNALTDMKITSGWNNLVFYSENYKKGEPKYDGTGGDEIIGIVGQIIYIRNTNYTDATAFKTAMSGYYVCYELETPTEITLPPADVNLLKGSNTVWTDGDNIALTYSADIKEWVLAQLQS